MTEAEVRRIVAAEVREAIRAHEVRVGIVSGLAGVVILGGIFHAVWMLRSAVLLWLW